jgi:glycogen debranching enzyme
VKSEDRVDRLVIDGEYSIRASSEVADIPKLVLKHDSAFLVADRLGDVPGLSDGAFRFYAEDTRFLRRLELHLDGRRPLLLNATIGGESWQSAIDLTNADVVERGRVVVPSRTFRISRRLTVFDGRFYQVVVIESFARQAHEVTLSWDFGADFVDVFEVRGHRRLERGTVQTPWLESSAIDLHIAAAMAWCARRGSTSNRRPLSLRAQGLCISSNSIHTGAPWSR